MQPGAGIIQVTLDPRAIRTLLAEARSEETGPFDDDAPLIICETDELHYGSRGYPPGIMAPQHEGQMQDLGAMPGLDYGPAHPTWPSGSEN
jgi:hypothetical protein